MIEEDLRFCVVKKRGRLQCFFFLVGNLRMQHGRKSNRKKCCRIAVSRAKVHKKEGETKKTVKKEKEIYGKSRQQRLKGIGDEEITEKKSKGNEKGKREGILLLFVFLANGSTTFCRDYHTWRLALKMLLLLLLLVSVLLLLLFLLYGIHRRFQWAANAARFERETSLHQQGFVRRRQADRHNAVVAMVAVVVAQVADAQLVHHRLIAVQRLSLQCGNNCV